LALKREKPHTQAAPQRRRLLSFDAVISFMNSIGTVWVFVLLVIINLDIGGRAIFNSPLRGVPEVVAMSMVACVFLQIAHTLKVGRLTRSEVLLNLFQARFPKLRQFCEGLYHLVGACLLAVLFSASVPLFTHAWEIGEYVGAEGDFMVPIWPVKLIILMGCVAGSVQFLILAFRNFRPIVLLGKTRIHAERGRP
jgi:TRAP-type mannitol/chloroaromatic compound transport system permease small subunit